MGIMDTVPYDKDNVGNYTKWLKEYLKDVKSAYREYVNLDPQEEAPHFIEVIDTVMNRFNNISEAKTIQYKSTKIGRYSPSERNSKIKKAMQEINEKYQLIAGLQDMARSPKYTHLNEQITGLIGRIEIRIGDRHASSEDYDTVRVKQTGRLR